MTFLDREQERNEMKGKKKVEIKEEKVSEETFEGEMVKEKKNKSK